MKTLYRIFFIGIFYILLYFQLTASIAHTFVPEWQLKVLLYTISGPILFYLGCIHSGRFRIYSLLFLKALFALIILYPCGNNPSLFIIIITLFTAESVLLLNTYWPLTFIYQFFILLFICFLPRHAWGRTIQIPQITFFPFFCCFLGAATYSFRKFILLQETIALKNTELHLQKDLIDQVYLLNSQFQEYALNVERKSAEEERKRITRDIHDIMGYTLVNLRVMLEVAVDLAGNTNSKLTAILNDAIKYTREGLQSARMALRNLRIIEESAESWMNRMHRITQTFSQATGVSVHISWGNVTKTNCPRLLTTVYQFVQEALTNSFKHGKAASVEIDFRIVGTTPADFFIARVIDNGLGSKEVIPGIGFSGMQERIALLEGETGYRNLENGFEVWVSIPMLSMRKMT